VHLLNASGTFFLCSDRAALTPEWGRSAIVIPNLRYRHLRNDAGRRFGLGRRPTSLRLDSPGIASDATAGVPSLSEIASLADGDQP
jgi:hypothetical protein